MKYHSAVKMIKTHVLLLTLLLVSISQAQYAPGVPPPKVGGKILHAIQLLFEVLMLVNQQLM